MDLRPLSAAALLALLAFGVAGCRSASPPSRGVARGVARDTAAALRQAHPSFVQPGGVPPARPLANPLANDPAAAERGARLFDQYNCSGCHGDAGAGSWSPALADGRWRYGGTPAEIYQSIHDGRPFGMPAFGRLLRDEQLWQLAAYLESVANENPAEATVGRATWEPGAAERSGKPVGGAGSR
jgi:cytochrome c oxidase cbb3-type subunit 3